MYEHRYTYIYIYMCIYICIYIYIYTEGSYIIVTEGRCKHMVYNRAILVIMCLNT